MKKTFQALSANKKKLHKKELGFFTMSTFALFCFIFLISGCSLFDKDSSDKSDLQNQSQTIDQTGTSNSKDTMVIDNSEEDTFVDLSSLPILAQAKDYDLPGIKSTTLPENFSRIGANTPISIVFSEEMDQEATFKALIIDPPIEGDIEWKDNTMTFTPKKNYDAGTKYTIILTNDALNKEGNNLPESLKREFEVTGELEILAVTPQDVEVSEITDISIIFNQPIFELGALDELEKHDFGIEVEPKFNFRYRLASTNVLQIQGQIPQVGNNNEIEHRLPRSTDFTITIPAGFEALSGAKLQEKKTFKLSTPRIKIYQPQDIYNPFQPLYFSFNQPVDLEDFKNKIEIISNEQQEYDFEYATSRDVKSYVSTDDEEIKTDYTRIKITSKNKFWGYQKSKELRVKSGVRGIEGNLFTEEQINKSITTSPFVNINNPSDLSRVSPNQEFIISFDHPPISLEEIKSHLKVESLVSFQNISEENFSSDNQKIPQAVSFDLSYKQICKDPDLRGTWLEEECEKINDTRRVVLQFKEKLQNETSYTITIASGLKTIITEYENINQKIDQDWIGQNFYTEQDYNFTFTVAPKPEILGFYGYEDSYKEFCIFSNNELDQKSFLENINLNPELKKDIQVSSFQVHIRDWEKESMQKERRIRDCKVEAYEGNYAMKVSALMGFENNYKITLLQGLEDVYNQPIGKEKSFNHATKALLDEDILINTVTNDFAIAPAKNNPIAVFKTVNVPENLTIDICRLDIAKIQNKNNVLYDNYSKEKWIPDAQTCDLFKSIQQEVPNHPWEDIYLEVNLKEILGDEFQNGTYIVAASHPRFTQSIYERGYGAQNEPKIVQRYVYSKIMVSDLAILAKSDQDKNIVWVNRMSDGSAIENAEIYAVNIRSGKYAENKIGQTNQEGILETQNQSFDYLIARVNGDEVMSSQYWQIGDGGWFNEEVKAYTITDRPIYRPGDDVNGKITVYNDRDVNLKPIANKSLFVEARDGRYQEVKIENKSISTNDLGSAQFTFIIPADVALGNLRLTFCYNSFFGGSDKCFYHSIQVEEYKKPEFEVKAESEETDYIQDDKANVAISASYYFGAPVKDAKAEYRLKSKDYYFDKYKEETGFIFSEDGGLWLPRPYYYDGWHEPYSPPEENLKTEELNLGQEGKITVIEEINLPYKQKYSNEKEKKLDRNKLVDFDPIRISKTYIIEATAEDSNKNPIFTTSSFTAHATNQLVGIKPEKWSEKAGKEFKARIIATNQKGEPLSGKKVKYYFIYKETVEDEDDSVNPRLQSGGCRWCKKQYHIKEEIIKSETITTEQKPVEVSFTPDEKKPGSYRFVSEIIDENQRLHRSSFNFFIYSKDYIDVTQLEEKRIDLIADKAEYNVGDKAQITLKSPLKLADTKYIMSTERGLLHNYALVDFGENPIYELEITEKMIPNIHLCFTGQQFGEELAIASGCKDLTISTSEKELEVKISTDKDQYLPGENVKLDLEVISKSGEKKAEIAVIAVDKANLALVASSRENILEFLYKNREKAVRTIASMLKIITEIDLGDAMTLTTGGGNMFETANFAQEEAIEMSLDLSMPTERSMESVKSNAPMMKMADGMAKEAIDDGGLATKKRTDFRDTAFFKAIIETNEEGKTQINFDLPDNLTTWSIVTIALNKNFEAGENQKEVNTKKPLLVRPQIPRFIRFSDEAIIRANIHNETDEKMEVAVSLAVDNLFLDKQSNMLPCSQNSDETETILCLIQTVTVEPKSQTEVSWNINATESQTGKNAIITIKAESGNLIDEVEQKIPVKDLSTPETVASSGVTARASFFEKVRLPDYVIGNLGELKITTSATLANFLNAGLEYLVDYPYGCNEQIASRLLGLVVYKSAKDLENIGDKLKMPTLYDEYENQISYETAVVNALQTLKDTQRYDGGWGYWIGSQETSPTLTAHMVYVYSILRKNNVQFDNSIINRAQNYLLNYYENDQDMIDYQGQKTLERQWDARMLMLYALSSYSVDQDQQRVEKLTDLSIENYDKLSNYGRIYMLLHLQNLSDNKELQKKIHKEIQSTISVDPRGMFIRVGSSGWHYSLHNSSHKLTGLYLKALINDTEGNKFSENPFMPKMIRWLVKSRHDGRWQNTQATVVILDAFVDFFKKGKENLANYDGYIIADNKIAKKYHVDGQSLFDTHEVKIHTKDIVERGDKGLILQFLKEGSEEGNIYYDLVLRYFLNADQIEAREEGIKITRTYYNYNDEKMKTPVLSAKIGEVIKGRIEIVIPEERHYVAIESPIPAGTELINFNLATSDKSLKKNSEPDYYYDDYGYKSRSYSRSWWWYNPWTHEEMRDDRVQIFADFLPAGVYNYDFYLRVTHEGKYVVPPTRAEEMYFPEIFGRSKAEWFEVKN